MLYLSPHLTNRLVKLSARLLMNLALLPGIWLITVSCSFGHIHYFPALSVVHSRRAGCVCVYVLHLVLAECDQSCSYQAVCLELATRECMHVHMYMRV